jgi:hypothetical protein
MERLTNKGSGTILKRPMTIAEVHLALQKAEDEIEHLQSNKLLLSILNEIEDFTRKHKYIDTKSESQNYVVLYKDIIVKIDKLKELYCKE